MRDLRGVTYVMFCDHRLTSWPTCQKKKSFWNLPDIDKEPVACGSPDSLSFSCSPSSSRICVTTVSLHKHTHNSDQEQQGALLYHTRSSLADDYTLMDFHETWHNWKDRIGLPAHLPHFLATREEFNTGCVEVQPHLNRQCRQQL